MESTPTLHNNAHEAQQNPSEGVRKLGFWMFLGSEFLIFLGLIVAFAVTRNTAKQWPTQKEMGLLLVSLNTFILLASSFTVAMGIESVRENKKNNLVMYLIITAILGALFLMGQAVEYNNLINNEGHSLADAFGTAFFVLTGLHGLHVLVGVIWCVIVALRAAKGIYTSTRYATVEIFGLYWHFVDVVWIFIFTIVYLLNP
ncbi:MAG TPA: heme-copper oxidase subunit III [Thermoflexales bacterium]|nr:heme-copper oxidase subunit III [Thermoflexales bacterium]HQW34228.1 heme-copper oxidase subunit III [Thermoflexales bacterium]HQZ20673.1 heme-copper oxidase subunit III [Thermoflexales bacterium]HQZ99191.1 heme-copper oxidase subunit III [Thermoflexales bacterium]